MKLIKLLIFMFILLTAISFSQQKEKSEGNTTIVLISKNNRYYIGKSYGYSYNLNRSMALRNAEWKSINTPADSIPERKIKYIFNTR